MVRGGEDVLCGAARVCLYVGGTQAEIAKAWTRAREGGRAGKKKGGEKEKTVLKFRAPCSLHKC